MPAQRLHFLREGFSGTLQPGDLVLHLTNLDRQGPPYHRNTLAHVGIVVEPSPRSDYRLNDPVLVCHMLEYVRTDTWRTGARSVEAKEAAYRVEFGLSRQMDDFARALIVDRALGFDTQTDQYLRGGAPGETINLYWPGPPDPDANPNQPGRPGLYAFSCASFAYHCYRTALKEFAIHLDAMMEIRPGRLKALLGDLLRYVPPRPVRVLFPTYLVAAVESDSHPFRPDEVEQPWNHWHLIPEEARARWRSPNGRPVENNSHDRQQAAIPAENSPHANRPGGLT